MYAHYSQANNSENRKLAASDHSPRNSRDFESKRRRRDRIQYHKRRCLNQEGKTLRTLGLMQDQTVRSDIKYQLGQYLTPPDLVALLTTLCVRTNSDLVLDPSCGDGRFLREASSLIQSMGQHRSYSSPQIYGIDLDEAMVQLSRDSI